MKIYTRTGDAGKTSLLSGERVSKCHVRIDACGDIDELNAWIGVILSVLPDGQADVENELHAIQSDLLDIGALVATTPESPASDRITGPARDRTHALEEAIDRFDAKLEPLSRFILPGGSSAATWAHVSRTVCRRAERRVLSVRAQSEEKPAALDGVQQYLNRLSDFLFALARYCNLVTGQPDLLWQSDEKRD